MSVAPRDLLNGARQIRAGLADEAGFRAAISRAYYAAYHDARAFHDALPSAGLAGSATGSHEKLIAQLTNPTVPRADPNCMRSRRIGHILNDIYRLRIVSDYKITINVLATDADVALRQADTILSIS